MCNLLLILKYNIFGFDYLFFIFQITKRNLNPHTFYSKITVLSVTINT